MRLISTLFIALFAFVTVSAQPSSDSWTTFSPAGEEFSVNVPESMSVSNPVKRADRKDWDATYELTSAGVDYRIFSEGALGNRSVDIGLKLIRDFKPRGESVALEGLKGEKFYFIDDEGFNHAALHVKIGDNNVLFHAFSAAGDEALEKFINSVARSNNQVLPVLTPGPVADLPGVTPEPSPSPDKFPGVGNGIGSGGGAGSGIGTGSGRGQGSGSGSGSGTGMGSGSGSATAGGSSSITGTKGATTPLRILSKPRPGYTDAARSYNIQGTVTLRIVFQADGQIGNVSVVSKLPMGLTKSAINAAKSLRFEPQTVNGEPLSVIKTLQYTFTIY